MKEISVTEATKIQAALELVKLDRSAMSKETRENAEKVLNKFLGEENE